MWFVMARSDWSRMLSKRTFVLGVALSIVNLMMASGEDTEDEVKQGPRVGGLGIGIVIMLVVVMIALACLLGCHILCEENFSAGIICALVCSSLVLLLLVIWPKGRPEDEYEYESESESEYEYEDVTYDTTELVRIVFLVLVGCCMLCAAHPICANDCLLEHKAEKHDFTTTRS